MNILPDNIIDIIYKYKHNLEYTNVMSELIQHKIHCKYNVTIEMLKYMFYVNQDGFKIACLDVTSINVFAYELLNEIKTKNDFNLILILFNYFIFYYFLITNI